MPGRFAIDFGTSNTVIARWDEATEQAQAVTIPDLGRPATPSDPDAPAIVPSLIHYTATGQRWLGHQVLDKNLYESPATFRWMKQSITQRHRAGIRVHGRNRSAFDAGTDFLSNLLGFATAEMDSSDEDVAFSVPVEAYEHYQAWLSDVCDQAGVQRYRIIDEPSAAALGYGVKIREGDVFLVFDFGGGTLDVAIVCVEQEGAAQSSGGSKCRVLGKAGTDIGGSTLDRWIFQELLKRQGLNDADPSIRPISRSLLVQCERAKERLSADDQAEISAMNPDTGTLFQAALNRSELEDALDARELFSQINRTLNRAIHAAHERGFSEDHIQSVLMVGGSSRIPCIQRSLQRRFGRERVQTHGSLDAVAKGAAAFVAGMDFYNHIQHDYGIRYVDPKRGEYDYKVIVPRGTPYPTDKPLAKLTIKASYDGQTQLGLALFEIGEKAAQESSGAPMELVFDPAGAARVMPVSQDELERRTYFWINENTPTFLKATPPATRGERRFQVAFSIDDNKRLLITATDLKTEQVVTEKFPVVKLT